MTDGKNCPLCGSDKIRQVPHVETIHEPFGGRRKVSLSYDSCELCGTEGDFSDTNDALVQDVIDSLKSEAVKNILQDFSNENVNFAGMERALELPQRTLTKWKNGYASPAASGVTLLKFLRLFPWLVDVAEHKFDYNSSQRIHIKNAVNRLLAEKQFDDTIGSENNLKLEFHFHVTGNNTPISPTMVLGNDQPLLVQEC